MTIFANIFSGLRSRQHAPEKKPSHDLQPVGLSASVIGNSSAMHDDEGEDDTSQEEGGAVLWRNCRGCAFLCAAHEAKCQVCGTESPFQIVEDRVGNCEDTCEDNGDSTVVETVDLLGIESKKRQDTSSDVANQSTDDDGDDDSDDDDACDTESEGEFIPGTLDVPPPAGARVKVLYDDNQWHFAEVLAANGPRARIRFESGKRIILSVDFERHAVRPADYDSDDESEAGEDESDHKRKETDSRLRTEGAIAKESADGEEEIQGLLDEAPPVGTAVQVLYEDNQWHHAEITAPNGTKAMIRYSDGEEEELDFELYACRLVDCVGNEDDCVKDDLTKEAGATVSCENDVNEVSNCNEKGMNDASFCEERGESGEC